MVVFEIFKKYCENILSILMWVVLWYNIVMLLVVMLFMCKLFMYCVFLFILEINICVLFLDVDCLFIVIVLWVVEM